MNNKKNLIVAITLILLLTLVGCKGDYATISVKTEGNGNIKLEPKQEVYKKGSKVKITAIADKGWELDAWNGSLKGREESYQVIVDEDMLVKAKFVKKSAMFRGDLANRGIYDNQQLKGSKVKWVFGSWSDVAVSPSTPAIMDDLAYVGAEYGLYALDIETGREKWNIYTDNQVISSPTVVEDIVYFASINKEFYAADRRTGEIKWKFKTENTIQSSPAIVNGVIYLGDDSGYLYGINAKTGEKLGEFKVMGGIVSSPAIVEDIVYFGSTEGKLYAIDIKNWEEKWSFKTKDEILSSPAVVNNTVYFGGVDKYFYALDAKTGEKEWSFKAKGEIFSSAAVGDKRVYFADLKGNSYALDKETGEIRWKSNLEIPYPIISSPIIAGNKVYFAKANLLSEINIEDGSENLIFSTKGLIVSSLVLKDGIIYFVDENNHLYALGEKRVDNKEGDNQIKFEDEDLKELVSLEVGVYNKLTKENLSKIKKLDVGNRRINSIKGIEYLVNLEELNLSYNNIYDLSPLSKLKKLKKLNLSCNEALFDISPLSKLSNLTVLNLEETGVKNINSLANLKGLRYLDMSKTLINDISSLKNLKKLSYLNLNYTRVNNLSYLAQLSGLKELEMSGGGVKNLFFFKNLKNLEKLNLAGNQITNVEAIVNLINLQELYLNYNQIEDITPLAHLRNLARLDIRSNNSKLFYNQKNKKVISNLQDNNTEVYPEFLKEKDAFLVNFNDDTFEKVVREKINKPQGEITTKDLKNITELIIEVEEEEEINDLEGIEYMVNLSILDLFNTGVNYIELLTKLPSLKRVDLRWNQIIDINYLSEMKDLEWLFLAGEYYIEFDPSLLSNLDNLEVLMLSYMQLKELSFLENLTNLNQLDLEGNQISDLTPLNNLKKLKRLSLSKNKIKDINVLSKLRNLNILWLDSNEINNIKPLLKLNNLEEVYIKDNHLDLSENEDVIEKLKDVIKD